MNTVGEALGSSIDDSLSVGLPDAQNLGKNAASFISMFSSKYPINSSSVFVVLEADAMQLAIDAIKEVGNNGEAIKKYISSFGPQHTITGLLGHYYFNNKGDGQGLAFAIKKFADGKLIELK